MPESRTIDLYMCEDCEPYVAGANSSERRFELVFHENARKDTVVTMSETQLASIKRDIDRLLADPVARCRQGQRR